MAANNNRNYQYFSMSTQQSLPNNQPVIINNRQQQAIYTQSQSSGQNLYPYLQQPNVNNANIFSGNNNLPTNPYGNIGDNQRSLSDSGYAAPGPAPNNNNNNINSSGVQINRAVVNPYGASWLYCYFICIYFYFYILLFVFWP